MIKEVKRGSRTEGLSLRIDPKTKFVLDFMVRVTGFRITDLIEKAIRDFAEKTRVGDDFGDPGRNWLHYWHPDDGVRTIKMLFDPDIPTNFEEDEIKDFIEQHKEFFFEGIGAVKTPMTVFVQVLWPNISDYIESWRETKTQNRWATGAKMLEAIKAAGMKGPEWPRGTKPGPIAQPKRDLDDDIPF